MLKLVLHDWSDDEAVAILETCRRAMPGGARLLVMEGLIGPPNTLSPTHLIDLVMLVSFTGAERTEAEFAAVLGRAGFRLDRVIPTATDIFILEAVPK